MLAVCPQAPAELQQLGPLRRLQQQMQGSMLLESFLMQHLRSRVSPEALKLEMQVKLRASRCMSAALCIAAAASAQLPLKRPDASCAAPLLQMTHVLAKMQLEGIGCNPSVLLGHHEVLQQRMAALTSRATQLAGREFNMGSSAQLAQVLYEELRLPPPTNAGRLCWCAVAAFRRGGGWHSVHQRC